jgi:hypothetical protein
MDEKTKNEVKGQIEYYLSDDNLEGDKFFHDIISKDKDGYLDLEYILQCNKVKKNKWTKEQIIESLKESEKVELNEAKTKIRRKDNKVLPPLNEEKLINRKRNRENEQKSKSNKNTPIILSFSSDKETDFKCEDIESKYKSINPSLSVVYTKFNKNEGHFALLPPEAGDNEKMDKEKINFEKEFDIEGVKFNVKLCEGEDLDKFMKENESQIDMCTRKSKNKKKKKKTNTMLKEAVTLGDEEFDDLSKIKEKIRNLINEVKDEMIVLDESQTKFIKDLVKFHPDKKIRKKTEEIPFIGVGKLKENEYKKGFFGLNDKKEKEYDFLVYKCPERIMTEDRKKNKE